MLRNIRTEYPPDLLSTRRRIYLSLVTQLTVTQDTLDTRRGQWLSSILQAPALTITNILIVIFVISLIAFLAHTFATSSMDFGWLMELLSR